MANKPNIAMVPRGAARSFHAELSNATGLETVTFVLSQALQGLLGALGQMIRPMLYDPTIAPIGTDPLAKVWKCALSAADTQSLPVGVYYVVCWRTDIGEEDVPVLNGSFTIVDTPRPSPVAIPG